jgi:oligosaccharide repeat unit polymerase
MWCIGLFISTFGFFDIYIPSTKIYIYCYIVVVLFNLVYYTFSGKNKKSEIRIFKSNIKSKKYLVIIITNILAWGYSLKFLIRSIKIIKNYGFVALRAFSIDSSLGLATTTELLILQWIVQSIFIATIIIIISDFSLMEKKWTWLIIAFIDVLVYTLLFAERYMIMRLIVYMFFAHFFVRNNIRYNKKNNRIIYSIILVAITGLVFITMKRSWMDTSFLKSLISYFTGPFVYLDILISDIGSNFTPLYGLSIFGFIVNLIFGVFALLFGVDYVGSNYIINQVAQTRYMISPTIEFNALTTMLYPFYRDFGFAGIIIGTVFLSFICAFIYRKMTIKHRKIYVYLLVFMSFVVFDSILSYQLLFPTAGVSILLLFTYNFFENEK